MRQPSTTLVAALLAAALAAGCGSGDGSPSGDGAGSDRSATSPTATKTTPAQRASTRDKLVGCMRDAGFTVTHAGQDASTATTYTVTGDGAARKAVVIIHSNRNDAAGAARRAGEQQGLNTVPFGRAEFIRYKATDTEAGVIANCVAEQYVR